MPSGRWVHADEPLGRASRFAVRAGFRDAAPVQETWRTHFLVDCLTLWLGHFPGIQGFAQLILRKDLLFQTQFTNGLPAGEGFLG